MDKTKSGSASNVMPQVVRLARGAHTSPQEGACVVEIASMLAGEKFSDHPRSVCPVVAAYMRTLNDSLPDEDRQRLFGLAAELVGTRGSWAQRRKRAILCAGWAREMDPESSRATRVSRLFYRWHAAHCAKLALERGIGLEVAELLIHCDAAETSASPGTGTEGQGSGPGSVQSPA